MISLPKSVLLTKKEIYISLSTIEEHQKFCKAFLNSYHSFEKKKTEGKSKNNFKFEGEFFQTMKKQNQDEIMKWFFNLTEEQRIKICTIKNKWLVNLLIQLYLITKTYDNVKFKPFLEMKDLFKDSKNFSHMENDSYNNNLYQNNNENKFLLKNLSLYENFFGLDFPKNTYYYYNKQEEKTREIEKEFIDQIKIISLEDEIQLDTLILGKDILNDVYKIKKYLNIFSNEKCFQDWLLPIQINNNTYNFIFPHWMHAKEYFTIFELISGYLEQHILLNYEYFYYSKKIYEYSFSNAIVELYNENKSLVSFVNENYSTFGNSDPNKKEIISRMEIREIVRFVKTDEKSKIKVKYIKDIWELQYKSFSLNEDTNNNNILSKDFDSEIYQSLYQEMMQQGVDKIIDHITFPKFLDIVNCEDIVFSQMRKNILEYRRNKYLEELMKDDFLSSNSHKKKKKNKKKKKKGKNIDDNEDINNNLKKNNEIKEEDKKEEKKIEKISDKKEIIKEIKEFKFEEKNKEIKNNKINFIENMNINNENERNIKKENISEEDLKNININKNILENSNLKTKELSNVSEKKYNLSINEHDKSEENKEINHISEKDISIKKTKNKEKEIFLYPTNITKKKNKKNKKPCQSAKKAIDTKNNNNNRNNLNRERSSNKNSPSINIKNEKSINIFINTSNKSSSKKDKNNKVDNNLNLAQSPTPFLSQNESFSFDKEFDLSENNDKNINNELSEKEFENINNINNNKLQQKTMPKNITIINESNSKSIENIKTSNSLESNTNNFYSFSQNNFINYINIPIGSNPYTSYTPSEKFFDSLTTEIKNYNTKTLSNISNLIPIKNKYLKEIENLIKSELESKYEIKYGHYGSHFTELAIEGSDIDILIFYKNKDESNDKDFYKDILSALYHHNDKFFSIQSILTASVPVIKLQISISNEIKDLKLEHMGYLEGYWEFDKINFDLTFTQNEQEYIHSQQIVDYIKKSVITFPMITSLLLLIKRFFKIMKMNKSFHGGLSSFSLYLLILSFCKKFPTDITSKGKALFSFLGMFSFFEFDKFGIDVESPNIFYHLNNTLNINNYNEDENVYKKEINIKDPFTKLNVAKSSFKVDEIQITFRTAYDFLRTEGCYYDYSVFVHKTGYDNDFFKQIKNNCDIFDTSDFKIIKKMFTLNKKQYFCDFFAN